MKIVVLDGYAMNPGDLSWKELEALGELTVHERTHTAQTLVRSAGVDALLTNKTTLTREHVNALDSLRYIGVLATGYNVVDLETATDRGIVVTNVPAYSTVSVAQTVFAHILNITQGIAVHAASVRNGKWVNAPDFCYWDTPLIELAGKTLGIVGYGQIGEKVADLAQAFGMQVIVHTRTPARAQNLKCVELADLFCQADIVSLHCPLTPETEHLVNREHLSLMKPGALLINTGRGPLLDEDAVATALNNGTLAGAGLDVLSSEPPKPDNPLLTAKNCYITPHLAWASKASRQRLYSTAVMNLRAFINGSPTNVVNA